MARKTTVNGDCSFTLTDQQRAAAARLAEGQSDQELADAMGADVAAVAKWRRHPSVVAEVNRQRRFTWERAQDRLRALVPKALDKLGDALDGPDGWRVALELVKVTGMPAEKARNYGAIGIGPEDPLRVVDAEVRRRRPDLLSEYGKGGPVTDRERAEVLAEFAE